MEADFSGWATKAGLKCTDGRTIMHGAFKHQDKMTVPLVWQHGHTDPENVLGHAVLEAREEGVYTHAYFNDSPKAVHAKTLVDHKDIRMLSIWANDLIERGGRVLHGAIREVSLVISGANPGALIENVTIRHSDGDEVLDEEAIIYTGLELELKHADQGSSTTSTTSSGESIQDIIDSMDEKQTEVLHYMIGEALDAASKGGSAQQSNLEGSKTNDQEGSNVVTHNVFEGAGDGGSGAAHTLSHEDVKGIVADAMKGGSLKQAVEEYALAHGINEIDILFPEAQAVTTSPEFFSRRMAWVNTVLGGARKSPFARIKSWFADITMEEARAKGYVKGAMKKEEFFSVARRITTPQTIYKKQKLDRDDIIDITDFDVVTWMKGEMRIMLDEEIGRAILVGDGRDVADDDKIQETFIRPIATDDELYTMTVNVNIDDASSSVQEIIDAIVLARADYRGSGQPTFFTTEYYIAQFLLLKDSLGRRIYTSLDQLASEIRVSSIVPVEVLEEYSDEIIGIIYNPYDYTIGADKGGSVAMFDDFDIDYNQYKYLIETRISGALTKLKSAFVVKKVASTDTLLAQPDAPTFVEATGVVTLPVSTNYEWQLEDGTPLVDGAQTPIDFNEQLTVVAVADTGYYFEFSEGLVFTFTGVTAL